MLRDYDSIRAALAHDNLAMAREASARLFQAHGNRPAFAEPAVLLSKAESLLQARSAFARMSEAAQELTYKNRDYFLMGCSMDRCPVECSSCEMAKYPNWVQLDPVVENPFTGKANPHCGIVKSY